MHDLGLDAVLGQHRARGGTDVGVVEVHEAGCVEHGLALAEGRRGLVQFSAFARGADFEGLAGIVRQARAVMDIRPTSPCAGAWSCCARRSPNSRAEAVKVPSRPLRSVSASCASTKSTPFLRAWTARWRSIEMREIERPFVRRHVGHLVMKHMSQSVQASSTCGVVLLLHAIELAGRTVVDQVEQTREGIAKIEAAAAAVTDIEDALHLLFERLLVPEPGFCQSRAWRIGASRLPSRMVGALLAGGSGFDR